jgi:hypothetical protein
MISLEFKNWLILEAERMPLDQVDDKSCKKTCPKATVIWLITLEKNWEQYESLLPDEVQKIKYFVKEYDGGEHIEGLEYSKSNFKFNSEIYDKVIDIIPQEGEANTKSGVKPLSGGSISVRPRKITQSEEFGNYVSISEKITIPLKNGEGSFQCDDKTLAQLEDNGRVIARYVGENPNGSRNLIAGITNERGNVVGLMPHPEHAIDPLTGPTAQGLGFFTSILNAMVK